MSWRSTRFSRILEIDEEGRGGSLSRYGQETEPWLPCYAGTWYLYRGTNRVVAVLPEK